MLHHHLKKILFRFSALYPKNPDLSTKEPTFHSSKIRKLVRKVKLDVPRPDPANLGFGKYHTDHMITVDYDRNLGWSDPALRSFENLHLHPFSSCLHYAVQCYEGTKAYKNQKGEIRLFRVEQNALRLKRSSKRLTLPDFDGQELVNLIVKLVKQDEKWIPPVTECSLYVRPFHLGLSQTLGVHQPERSKLVIAAGPVGSYYATGFQPISLQCATDAIRSAPLGTGSFKIGGNYGPTIETSQKAAQHGHHQVLWLYKEQIVEVGSSNIFFIFKDKSGQIEVATPELEDLVLPGITRDSILEMLRDKKQYKVSERKIFIHEVIERLQKGELLECFGAGTAVVVSSVNNISYKGVNYPVPVDSKLNIGPISHKIRQNLLDIQQGRSEDRYGWITRVQ